MLTGITDCDDCAKIRHVDTYRTPYGVLVTLCLECAEKRRQLMKLVKETTK